MAIWSRKELASHIGHKLEIARYEGGESITIECMTCNVVLIAAEDLEAFVAQPEEES